MKRFLSFLLVALLAAASLTCFAYADYLNNNFTPDWTTVSQADTGASLTYTNGTYTASYTSTNLKEDGQYALIVVRCDSEGNYSSFSEVTIKYINQTVSDSGSISFDFIPMSTPDCVVLLSGDFNDVTSPVVLGTLVAKGIPVSGTVTSYGSSAPSVSIYDKGGNFIETVSATGGNYAFSAIPAGDTYYVKAEKAGHVGTPVRIDIGIDEIEATVGAIALYGGDINSNTAINVDDLSFLLGDYGKATPEDTLNYALSDINANNAVNVDDLSFLLAGYGQDDVSVADFIAG